MDLIIKFSADEAGASAVEYALLMAFIAVAIAGSVTTFGTAVAGLFDTFRGRSASSRAAAGLRRGSILITCGIRGLDPGDCR